MKNKFFLYIKKTIIIICLLITISVSISLWNIYYYSQNKKLHQADAIIVLGAAAWGNKPSPVYEARLKYATELFKQHYAKYIIFTGGTPKKGFSTEAQVGAIWAKKNNIPKKFIILENKSRDTVENIKNTLKISKYYNLNSFIIVSDSYHLARAKFISENIGLKNIQTSPTPYSLFNKTSIKNKIKIIAKESIWLVWFYYYKIFAVVYAKMYPIFKKLKSYI